MKPIDSLSSEEERASEVFRALGNPARVRIVVELARRNACATDLLEVLPLAASTVSRHLKVLKEARVIRGTIEDDLCYCIEPDTVRWLAQFWGELCCPADGSEAMCAPTSQGADASQCCDT